MDLLDGLREVVGSAHVLTDAPAYETDWTGRFSGRARCVVRPADTGQVAAVLARCAEAGQPVVPQGGNTGLVGGGVPRGGEVVLSLTRLGGLTVDPTGGMAVAGAGVTLAALQAAARAAGLAVGMDFAARDSATVGGMIATNAGGLRVLRYGDVRAQVNGVEAVLADGTVLSRLSKLRKDSGGYDLPGLLVGSEGTLAVVSRAVWALVPATPVRVVALAGLGSIDEALALVRTVRRTVGSLSAAETFGPAELALVRGHRGLGPPLPREHPCYLMLEAAGAVDATEELAAALADVPEVAVGERLWAYREGITEAIGAAGVPTKLDVAVPLDRLADFRAALPGVLSERARLFVFGHLAEGNLHVNLLDPAPEDEDAVLRLVLQYDGAISAEHGIGVAKARWLPLARRPEDVAAQRAIKAALDPGHLLNPGVLFS